MQNFIKKTFSNTRLDCAAVDTKDEPVYEVSTRGREFYFKNFSVHRFCYMDLLLHKVQSVQATNTQALMSDAIDRVAAVDEDSLDEGYELCADVAKNNAQHILSRIYSQFSEHELNFDIYPTRKREVAISYMPQKAYSLLILCDSQGGGACFSLVGAKKSRFRHSAVEDFCYPHLWQMFEQMGIQNQQELGAEELAGMSLNLGKYVVDTLYHADICLPDDESDDDRIEHLQQLASYSVWRARSC